MFDNLNISKYYATSSNFANVGMLYAQKQLYLHTIRIRSLFCRRLVSESKLAIAPAEIDIAKNH